MEEVDESLMKDTDTEEPLLKAFRVFDSGTLVRKHSTLRSGEARHETRRARTHEDVP